MRDINAELLRVRKELQKLEAEAEKERERTKNFTLEMRLAEMIHIKTCRQNHDDYCGWFYDKDFRGSTRARYLTVATNVLKNWKEIDPESPNFLENLSDLFDNLRSL